MTLVVVDHQTQEIASWRPGNRTRLKLGAAVGLQRLAAAEQWFEPGAGAPTHTHGDVEETITVLAGTADFWCDDERTTLGAEMSIVLPPLSWHGFTNVGDDELHVLVIWSVASVPTEYLETPDKTYAIGAEDGTRVDPARTLQD
jgi:quercetin dioxygenase-like cupin family protein